MAESVERQEKHILSLGVFVAINRRVPTFLPPLNVSFQLLLVNHSTVLLLQVTLQSLQDALYWMPLIALLHFFFFYYYSFFCYCFSLITMNELLPACLQDPLKCFPSAGSTSFFFFVHFFLLTTENKNNKKCPRAILILYSYYNCSFHGISLLFFGSSQ